MPILYRFLSILFKINILINLRFLRKNKNIKIGLNFKSNGFPIFNIREDCFLEIGDNVFLNSDNRYYHINMHSPVKIVADRKFAKIKIGENTRIHGSCIHAYESITIGSNCLIAGNCQIFDGNGHDLSFDDVENRINTIGVSRPVEIGNNVWIGANTVILPGTSIGNGSVISANSVVKGHIPAMAVAGGNPAVTIKDYS